MGCTASLLVEASPLRGQLAACRSRFSQSKGERESPRRARRRRRRLLARRYRQRYRHCGCELNYTTAAGLRRVAGEASATVAVVALLQRSCVQLVAYGATAFESDSARLG